MVISLKLSTFKTNLLSILKLKLYFFFDLKVNCFANLSFPDMQQSADFYQKTDVRPPFTYASLIRQVKHSFFKQVPV